MSQEHTSLSPRLKPLMIQNDRRTGNLIHPQGESSRPSSLSSSHSQERRSLRDYSMGPPGGMPRKLSAESGSSTSPPLRQMALERDRMGPPESYHRKGSGGSGSGSGASGSPPLSALVSPTERVSRLPSYDSAPHLGERKASTSIGHLLNHLSMSSRSPPPESEHSRSASPLSVTHPHPHHLHQHPRAHSPPHYHERMHSPPHRPRPLHSHSTIGVPHMHHLAHDPYNPISPPLEDPHQRRSVTGPIMHRPDMYRRHSAHPYEHEPPHVAQAHRQQELQAYRQEYIPLGLTGSRAPISRTTKACNGCRIRKVRCDAGGGGPASEPSTCSRCREAGVPCVYSGVQKKRGPCPGTARPTLARRKSSIPNLQGHYSPPANTPTSRASYGFPPPLPSSHSYPSAQHRPSMPDTWSDRPIGHGRPPPPPPRHEAPRADQPGPTLQRKPSLFSWPTMEPAVEADEHDRRKVFPQEYTLRPKSPTSPEAELVEDRNSFFGDKGRQLPPLRMVISRPSSTYYDPIQG